MIVSSDPEPNRQGARTQTLDARRAQGGVIGCGLGLSESPLGEAGTLGALCGFSGPAGVGTSR